MRETISLAISGSARRASVIGVTMGPGCTELARMRSRAYWMAVALVSRRTAPLDAWYTLSPTLREYFGKHFPAITLVGARDLFDAAEGAMIEIEGVAIV